MRFDPPEILSQIDEQSGENATPGFSGENHDLVDDKPRKPAEALAVETPAGPFSRQPVGVEKIVQLLCREVSNGIGSKTQFGDIVAEIKRTEMYQVRFRLPEGLVKASRCDSRGDSEAGWCVVAPSKSETVEGLAEGDTASFDPAD
ncbi:hypothetical protein [Mesorhizobium sp. 43Arga]